MGYRSFAATGGGEAIAGNRMVAHDATLSGGATWHWPLDGDGVEAVVGGGALDLTGTKTYESLGPGENDVQVMDATNSTLMDTGAIGAAVRIQTAITVACWIRRDAGNATNLAICGARIAGSGETNNIQWEIGLDTDEKVRFIWQDGAADNTNIGTASVVTALDTWEHWTHTRPTAGTSGKLYKNGVFDSETTGLNKATGGGSISDVTVGHSKGGAEFPGLLSSAIVFETEMNAAAVLALYESTLVPASPSVDTVVHVPLTGLETNAVVAFSGNSTTTDLAGDSVLDEGTVLYVTNGHYDGVTDCFAPGTANLISTTGDAAHKVAIASAITYAGMAFDTPGAEANPYILISHTGISTFNYGLLRLNGRFYIKAATNYDTSVTIPANSWFHWCVTMPANRLTAKFYLNGKLAFTSGAIGAGTVGAGDSLGVGTIDAAQGDWVGRLSDIIIADSEYNAAAIRTLAENAFGHALP